MMKPIILAVMTIGAAGTARAEPRPAVWAGELPGTTVGAIEVAAYPSDVYATLADVERWPQLFGDVRSVEVAPALGARLRARLTSVALGSRVPVLVERQRERRVRLVTLGTPRGLHAAWEALLIPTDAGRRTLVRLTFTMRRTGLAGWVPDDAVRMVRERKLMSDLLDLARRFDARFAPEVPTGARPSPRRLAQGGQELEHRMQ